MPPLRLAFMGTPDFAAASLAALIAAGHDIAAVYSQPPRPAGRGQQPRPSPVQRLAESHDLPILTPTTLKTALGLDAAVVVAYGLLLPRAILESPRLGCLNVHASLLPRWRGAAPIQRAILAGDRESGITIMQMDQGLDTGPILLRRAIEIGHRETGAGLHDRELRGDLWIGRTRNDTSDVERSIKARIRYACDRDHPTFSKRMRCRGREGHHAARTNRAARADVTKIGAVCEVGNDWRQKTGGLIVFVSIPSRVTPALR